MTKAEIVADVANKTGIEKVAIALIFEEFMKTIKDCLYVGEDVNLRGFGTFEVYHKAERYQNIKQGTERLLIPAHKEPKFRPCKEFKEMLK